MVEQVATRNFRLRHHFPGYRKRVVNVVPTTRVTVCDLNWSGGTRSEYFGITFSGLAFDVRSMSSWNTPAPWNNAREGTTVNLAPGTAMVRTGYFCGKESTLTIYVHPSDLNVFAPKA